MDLDDNLKGNLDNFAYNVKKHNWDWLHINSGMERSGKSGFSLFMARFLSEECGLKFDWSPDLKNVFFFEKNLAAKMMKISDKSVVLLDEGGEMLMSRRAMEKEVVNIIQTLMIYGSKNIFLIINIPDWRWLDKYVRESRIRSLCVVRTRPRFVLDEGKRRVIRERGYYSFYARQPVVNASRNDDELGKAGFRGRFGNFARAYPREWECYSAKKTAFLENKIFETPKKSKN